MSNAPPVHAAEALDRLRQGNQRYVDGKPAHPHTDLARRAEVAQGQHPFAALLGCADSRVPPELVFDQGIGDLFVIRVAGNVAREKVIGSIEFAVSHLGVQLVVVMGHEACGAVAASMAEGPFAGHIGAILENIKPAVYLARTMAGDVLQNATKLNAKLVAEQLKDSQPILHPAIGRGELAIVPAYYQLDGRVVFLDD